MTDVVFEPTKLHSLLSVNPSVVVREIAQQIDKGEQIIKTLDQFGVSVVKKDLTVAKTKLDFWKESNLDLLSRGFSGSYVRDQYLARPTVFGVASGDLRSERSALHGEVGFWIGRLEALRDALTAIIESTEYLPVPVERKLQSIPSAKVGLTMPTIKEPGASTIPVSSDKGIFVVHGRDEAPKEAVARFVERLGFSPVILHENPSGGKTIIEKLEKYSDVGFVIVLLTPDDRGALKDGLDSLKPRARQNVIFELGYFIGKLGRNRVSVLYTPGVELPSDYERVVYIELDQAKGWRLALARELRSAGFQIDLNKIS